MKPFEESIEWSDENHVHFWIIFHNEATQTIKKILSLTDNFGLQKLSNILISRNKNTMKLLEDDLKCFDEKVKKKKHSSENIENLRQVVMKNDQAYIRFKNKFYALYALCLFESNQPLKSRYTIVQNMY